ncbi:MAG: pantetheine-phosphate adenylyltransferase [Clostridia bacterium]|nr:pantetheine-phosphate adenylyltransferase [Clostridia bacterium]
MKALMPGSFDPCTAGHLDLIARCCAVYDEVTVAVFINPEKRGLFSYVDRVEFLRLATAGLPNVTVTFCEGMVADYARDGGFSAIVKGVRDERDRTYEEAMAAYNLERGGVPTLLWPAGEGLSGLSSTEVRRALAAGLPLSGLVPREAEAAIRTAYKNMEKSLADT